MKDIILYHGSKGGIKGKISPISPRKGRKYNPCDFGDAFYLGTNINQAKGVCVDADPAVLYTVRLRLSEIDESKILTLKSEEWLYAVTAFRRQSDAFNGLSISKEITDYVNQFDIIIGTIADDRLNKAMLAYNRNNISDKGLMACLKKIDYGMQYALKTQNACDLVEVIDKRNIFGNEKKNTRDFISKNNARCNNVVNEMKRLYRRRGIFLDELAEKIKTEEITIEDIFKKSLSKGKKKPAYDPSVPSSPNRTGEKKSAEKATSSLSLSNDTIDGPRPPGT